MEKERERERERGREGHREILQTDSLHWWQLGGALHLGGFLHVTCDVGEREEQVVGGLKLNRKLHLHLQSGKNLLQL